MKHTFAIAAFLLVTSAFAVSQQESGVRGNAGSEETVCGILANPTKYVGQRVTVRATLAANQEFSAFTNDSCEPEPSTVSGKHPLIAPRFNRPEYDRNSRVARKLTNILKKNNQARVTVRGVFIDPGQFFGHQLCCRYELDVLEVVSAEPVKH